MTNQAKGNGVDDELRRREAEATGEWRGGIKARVETLEKQMGQLAENVDRIKTTVTKMDGRLQRLQGGLDDCREDIAKATSKVDEGRNSAVKELKDTISEHEARASAWRLTRFQVFLAAALALITSSTSSLIFLAITGQLS